MSDEKKEEPVVDPAEAIKGKKYSTKRGDINIEIDGNPNWTIVRLKGDVRDDYLVDMASRYDFAPDGKRFFARPKGMQAFLVSLCIRDPDGKKVPTDVIQQGWDADMITQLYEDCAAYNGLNEKARDVGKKDLKAKAETGTE